MKFKVFPKVNLLKSKLNEYQTEVKDVESYGRPKRDTSDEMVYNLQNKDLEFIELLSGSSIKKILMPKLNDIHYRFLDNEYPNYILIFKIYQS